MSKEKLIQSLVHEGYLKTQSVTEAFKKIDRADFVSDEEKTYAYVNSALPIGYGQTISQPLTVAFMLELLEPKQGEKILDVGSGSGWSVALLSHLVGDNGKVIGIERVSELVKIGEENTKKYGFIEKGIAEIINGDGSKGHEKEAPYDKIISAATAKEIPENWKSQLKIDGVIVAPVNHSIIRLKKKSKNEFEKKEYFGFSFVPLISGK